MKDNIVKLTPEHNLNFSSENSIFNPDVNYEEFYHDIVNNLKEEFDIYVGMIDDFQTFYNNRKGKRTSLPIKRDGVNQKASNGV